MRTLPVQRSLLGTDRVSMIIDYGIPCSKQENWIGFVFQAGETFGGGGVGVGVVKDPFPRLVSTRHEMLAPYLCRISQQSTVTVIDVMPAVFSSH